jgi:hypothetical protein
MTKVNIDLWVLLVGVALPSACLLLISLSYCWRRLTRRRSKAVLKREADPSGFNQQVLLEMVLQQTDNAFNSIVDAVHRQRMELLTVLETHKLPSHLSTEPLPQTAPLVNKREVVTVPAEVKGISATPGARIRTAETAAIFDPYSQIPEQIQKGLSVAEVAAGLNLPESAVELYVKLRLSAPNRGSQKRA